MNKKMNGQSRIGVKNCMVPVSAAVLLLLLAACGAEKQQTTAEGPSGTTPVKKDPVKLVFYSTAGWTQEAFNERFGDTMRKKFPGYEIEYVASGKGMEFPDMLSAGAQIDVYWQAVDNTIPHLLQYKLEYDMTELIKKYGVNLNQLEPSSVEAARSMSNGKMYALPIVNNAAALYYNKDLFDKFGVPYLKDGVTWDEVIGVAKRMRRTDGGLEYYGIGSDVQPHLNLSSLSIPYVDPKTEKPTILTNGGWSTVFNQLVEMKKTTDFKGLNASNFVQEKNLAMVDGLANAFLNFDMTTLNWDLVSYPSYKSAPGIASQPLPTMFGITSISKHKEAAAEVLAYMLSEEVQKSLSERAIIPVLQSDTVMKAFAKNSKYKDKNFQAILAKKFAPITPKVTYEAKARSIYGKYVPDLAKGTIDLNTAFRQIDEEMAKLIAEEKAKQPAR